MSLTVVGDAVESPQLVLAPVDQLAAHPDNPRRSLGDLRELVASVRAHGVLEPLIVVPGDAFNAATAAQPVAVRAPAGGAVGDRGRASPARRRGQGRVAAVPVLPRPDLADPAAALEVMLVESVQRSALTPVEEARAFARLRQAGRSQREIAGRLGCAQSQVSKRLALLDLPEPALVAVDAGRLPRADAAEILRLRTYPQDMAEMVEELLRDGRPEWTGERLRAVVDGELQGIEGRENTRRLLGEAEADRAGSIEPHDWSDGDDGDGPDEVSGGGVTVRRVDPGQPTATAPDAVAAAAMEQARREAAADREQGDAAELARDEVCQKLVAAFAADPTSALLFLAGHVLTDASGDEYSYADTGRVEGWLTVGELAVFGEDDEPEMFGWLDRTADEATRLLVAGALALAAAERRLAQHAAYGGWDVHDLAHLDRLVAAGYALSDWEQHHADQVLATCTATDVCGHPYGHPGDCDQVVEAGSAGAEPA